MDPSLFHRSLRRVAFHDERLDSMPLEAMVGALPSIDTLGELPRGTPVLLRFDLDIPTDAEGEVTDFARLEAGARTVRYCHDRGWKTVMFGHVGRHARNSAEPISRAMSEFLGLPVRFVPDWLDPEEHALSEEFVQDVQSGQPGDLFVLENTRKYSLETALWSAEEESFSEICDKMYRVSKDIRERLATTELNEAIAASNLDFSSAAVPLMMSKTGLGFFIDEELKNHVPGARKADVVVFSGLKMNKLDDLEDILATGKINMVLAAGAIGLALLKGKAQSLGGDFFLGRAETDPDDRAYIEASRVAQGRRIAERCAKDGIELVLPVDFVLDSGEVGRTIPAGGAQMDVGPASSKMFREALRSYIEGDARSGKREVVFYNGVFGKFEDPRFESGTRSFIHLLRTITDSGISTYVGGGEGRKALLKYGSLEDVTHAFTCGGTILKALGTRQIPYLKAMYLQSSELSQHP